MRIHPAACCCCLLPAGIHEVIHVDFGPAFVVGNLKKISSLWILMSTSKLTGVAAVGAQGRNENENENSIGD